MILEISSADEIHKVLKELQRVTANQGTIILTCSKEGYLTGADSFEPLLTAEQRANLKDGDPVPTRIRETGQVFTDYYWSDEFLKTSLQKAGLTVVAVKLPTEPSQGSEALKPEEKPPYVIYVSKKVIKQES